MFLGKDSPTEMFSLPMTHDGAQWAAKKLERDGYKVMAVVTAEHAAERQAMLEPGGGLKEGAHLHSFLSDIVKRFRQDYPGVPKESALEVISLLCTLYLEGEADLQSALLDEVHAAMPVGVFDWRKHMQMAIANRRPEGER